MGCPKLDILNEKTSPLQVVWNSEKHQKSGVDVYPFGSLMPGRNFNAGEYRYSFNGKEKDDEVMGVGNSLDFGARIYDSRTGRWKSPDPNEKEYPAYSTYNAFMNNPVILVDEDGKGATVLKIYQNGTLIGVQVSVVIYVATNNSNININQVASNLQNYYQNQFNSLPNTVTVKRRQIPISYNVTVIPVSGGTAGLQNQMSQNNSNNNLPKQITSQYNYIMISNVNIVNGPVSLPNGKLSNNVYTMQLNPDNTINSNFANVILRDVLDIPTPINNNGTPVNPAPTLQPSEVKDIGMSSSGLAQEVSSSNNENRTFPTGIVYSNRQYTVTTPLRKFTYQNGATIMDNPANKSNNQIYQVIGRTGDSGKNSTQIPNTP